MQLRQITGHISFGEMLLSYWETQEISQVKMAEKLYISKQDFCNIERERIHVTVG